MREVCVSEKEKIKRKFVARDRGKAALLKAREKEHTTGVSWSGGR